MKILGSLDWDLPIVVTYTIRSGIVSRFSTINDRLRHYSCYTYGDATNVFSEVAKFYFIRIRANFAVPSASCVLQNLLFFLESKVENMFALGSLYIYRKGRREAQGMSSALL